MDSLQQAQRKEGKLISLRSVTDSYALGGLGKGWGEKIYRTILYVLDWSCFRVLRLGEICYQNIYSIGHMMCELVTLLRKKILSRIQNIHFAFLPAPSVFLPPTPESPR